MIFYATDPFSPASRVCQNWGKKMEFRFFGGQNSLCTRNWHHGQTVKVRLWRNEKLPQKTLGKIGGESCGIYRCSWLSRRENTNFQIETRFRGLKNNVAEQAILLFFLIPCFKMHILFFRVLSCHWVTQDVYWPYHTTSLEAVDSAWQRPWKRPNYWLPVKFNNWVSNLVPTTTRVVLTPSCY